MNCFPCKGPACNSCKKFDRINSQVITSGIVRCKSCGGKVDLSTGQCMSCGSQSIEAPGKPCKIISK
jgi:hypothetical protein